MAEVKQKYILMLEEHLQSIQFKDVNNMNIDFYLDVPYKKGADIKKHKKEGKVIPVSLLSEKETSVYMYLTFRKKVVKSDRAKLLKVKTDYKCYPKNWDFKTKLPNPKPAGGMDLKIYLEEMKADVFKAYREYCNSTTELNLNKVKEIVEGIVKREENLINANKFFDVFDKYLERKVRNDLTKKKYATLKTRLLEFQTATTWNLTFESIGSEFVSKYKGFLIDNKKYGNNTVEKYVMDLKAFLKWAYEEEYHKNTSYEKLKASRDQVEVISLEFAEFEQIIKCMPESDRLQKTKDVFLFQCLTAQRYADVESIDWSDIDLDNSVWRLFQKKGRKTTPTEIPLHPIAKAILKKYQGQEKPLPVLSNQKYNDNIKELCEKAGITKIYKNVSYSGDTIREEVGPKYQFISSHSGRKTFINIAPLMGIPMEVTMSITGHKSLKVVQDHYRKVSFEEKKAAMEKLVLNVSYKAS